MKKYDVVGIGAYCVDFLTIVEEYPTEDQKYEVGEMYMEGGGNVATGCIAVARLGGDVAYHGTIGNDFLSGSVLEGFKSERVDISWIEQKKGITPFSFIIINKRINTRTIIFRKKGIPEFGQEDVREELIKSAGVLLIDFYHPLASLKASEIAGKNNIPVVLDAESIPPLAEKIISNVSHLICSRTFAVNYTGLGSEENDEMLLRTLVKKVNCEVVGITLGNRGSIFYERNSGSIIHQDAFRVNVLDTTGAGDVFHGTFSFFLARGFPLRDIIKYSSACASLSCRGIGGRAGIPAYNELIEYIEGTGAINGK